MPKACIVYMYIYCVCTCVIFISFIGNSLVMSVDQQYGKGIFPKIYGITCIHFIGCCFVHVPIIVYSERVRE